MALEKEKRWKSQLVGGALDSVVELAPYSFCHAFQNGQNLPWNSITFETTVSG